MGPPAIAFESQIQELGVTKAVFIEKGLPPKPVEFLDGFQHHCSSGERQQPYRGDGLEPFGLTGGARATGHSSMSRNRARWFLGCLASTVPDLGQELWTQCMILSLGNLC